MSLCIPSMKLKARKRLPWLTKPLLVGLYTVELGKLVGSQYGTIQETEKQDCNHFSDLKGANSWKFWSTVCSLNKSASSIPTLEHGLVTATTYKEKAELLNSSFSQCFNRPVQLLQPNGTNSASHSDESILCTPESVNYLLLEIDVSKATDPDGISRGMLKGTAQSTAIPLCKLFNMSVSTGSIPQEWRTSINIYSPCTQVCK